MLFDIVTVWSILIIQLLPTCTFMQQASLAVTTCLILLYSTVLHQKIKLQNFVNFQTSQCLTTLCTFLVLLFVCISGLNKDMVYFKKKKAMKIHIRKPQPNDKRIWYAQWKTCRVLYRNKMCLKSNTWTYLKVD